MLATTAPAPLEKTELFAHFSQFIRLDVASGDASSDTVKTYASSVKQFFAWCTELRLHPLDATREELKEYRRWLVEVKKYKSATIALKLTVVRRFYAGAIEQGLVLSNPALGLKPPRENRDPAERINYLEEDEAAQLLAALPTDNSVKSLRDRLLLGVMLLEGCRTVEMHRLSVSDIIRRGSDVGLRVEGKRSKRIVPLTPDLASLLRKYLKARKEEGEAISPLDPLFISVALGTKGERLSRRSIQRVVDKYLHSSRLKKMEGKTLSAHSLRHTAGTLALRAGSELRQVQDLLGHADPRTISLYAHIADRWRHNPALRLRVTVRV